MHKNDSALIYPGLGLGGRLASVEAVYQIWNNFVCDTNDIDFGNAVICNFR